VVSPRPGFGLAEVIVALVVIAGGVLAVASAAGAAAGLLRAAHAEETAVDAVGSALDSVLAIAGASPSGGELRAGPVLVAWRVAGGAAGEAEAVAHLAHGRRPRRLLFTGRATPP
jgi:hypothetical protein